MDDDKVMQNKANYNASLSMLMNSVQEEKREVLRALRNLLISGNNKDKTSSEEEENDDSPPTFEQNSGYNPDAFQIIIYLGYTLPPTYSIQYPLAVKYGCMGALMGHELMHTFDANQILAPAPGDEKMLEPDELDVYGRQKNCLINQYSQYCYKKVGTCLTGQNAIPDNIADIGGLKIAYAAYQFHRDVVGDEPPIPGLTQYTGDQILFMTYERWFCTKNTPEQFWSTADHMPDEARGPVALRNNSHFATSFKCLVGSAAAPMKTCEMWGDIYGTSKNSQIMK